jgi:DNA-binding PadR family transcriptional regulator
MSRMVERRGFKWALLGLVRERDAYGYMLIRRCEAMVGDAFELNPSAIYTSLRSLAEQGYVTVVGPHARGTLLEPKMVYRITEKGERAFDEWVATSRFEPVRSDLALKLALVRPRHARTALLLLDDAELECLAMIRALSERVAAIASDPWQTPLLRHSQELGLDALNARVAWLRRGRAVLLAQVERYENGELGNVRE